MKFNSPARRIDNLSGMSSKDDKSSQKTGIVREFKENVNLIDIAATSGRKEVLPDSHDNGDKTRELTPSNEQRDLDQKRLKKKEYQKLMAKSKDFIGLISKPPNFNKIVYIQDRSDTCVLKLFLSKAFETQITEFIKINKKHLESIKDPFEMLEFISKKLNYGQTWETEEGLSILEIRNEDTCQLYAVLSFNESSCYYKSVISLMIIRRVDESFERVLTEKGLFKDWYYRIDEIRLENIMKLETLKNELKQLREDSQDQIRVFPLFFNKIGQLSPEQLDKNLSIRDNIEKLCEEKFKITLSYMVSKQGQKKRIIVGNEKIQLAEITTVQNDLNSACNSLLAKMMQFICKHESFKEQEKQVKKRKEFAFKLKRATNKSVIIVDSEGSINEENPVFRKIEKAKTSRVNRKEKSPSGVLRYYERIIEGKKMKNYYKRILELFPSNTYDTVEKVKGWVECSSVKVFTSFSLEDINKFSQSFSQYDEIRIIVEAMYYILTQSKLYENVVKRVIFEDKKESGFKEGRLIKNFFSIATIQLAKGSSVVNIGSCTSKAEFSFRKHLAIVMHFFSECKLLSEIVEGINRKIQRHELDYIDLLKNKAISQDSTSTIHIPKRNGEKMQGILS